MAKAVKLGKLAASAARRAAEALETGQMILL
jgi:hypothetical protein